LGFIQAFNNMTKGFINRFFTRMSKDNNKKTTADRRIIPRDHHSISRKQISPMALKVLYRLKDAGYESYLVGGGVRDLLLNISPKDFDIATHAHPEEVHKLFHNSRLIGRRFKLVHVLFGREIIEVATFRGNHAKSDAELVSLTQSNKSRRHTSKPKGRFDATVKTAHSDEGMLLRDNVYGTVEEDALRRDFTVNALYYSIDDFTIHDFANGLEDIKSRTLRLIGDPETRYREDPVRMLRAIRFATKLNFKFDPSAEKPIADLASLLHNVPAARLFEEVLKLFMNGQALNNFNLLRRNRLFSALFPEVAHLLDDQSSPRQKQYIALIQQALSNTDERIQQQKPTTPAFLYAAFLWPAVLEEWETIQNEGIPPFPAMQQAAQRIIFKQTQATSIPKRFSFPMKEIWELQLRLPKHRKRKPELLAEHPRFRAAYDFLLLREQSGENLEQLGEWWTDYQQKNSHLFVQHKRQNKPKAADFRHRKRPYKKGPAH
jgi:poly(A) polymerase